MLGLGRLALINASSAKMLIALENASLSEIIQVKLKISDSINSWMKYVGN